MSAVKLSDFQFSFDASCVGHIPLRVFPEPQSRLAEVVEVVKPEVIESQSLVELYNQLLGPRDAERRITEKTIRDNKSVLRRFQNWSEQSEKFAVIWSTSRQLSPSSLCAGRGRGENDDSKLSPA